MSVALLAALAGNVVLVLALLVTHVRNKENVIQEKLATFAGVVGAFTYGAGMEDFGKRWERQAIGFAGILPDVEQDEIKWRLLRSSVIHMFRHKPALADMSEHVRSIVMLNASGESDAEMVWTYIDGLLGNEPGHEQEAFERFTELQLGSAQVQTEGPLHKAYERAIRSKANKQ